MKFLNNKKGVTVLEGIIALGLLAVVTAGAFGVLLSASRKSNRPDIHEEMIMAIETAKDMLQMYVSPSGIPDGVPYPKGLCGNEVSEGDKIEDTNPLSEGTHSIKCMLPPICDKTADGSSFTYEVSSSNLTLPLADSSKERDENNNYLSPYIQNITFNISCNGYEL